MMALFDSLEDDYHQVGMDNLYNLAAFCMATYNHPRKFFAMALLRGVVEMSPPAFYSMTQRKGRGNELNGHISKHEVGRQQIKQS